MVTAHRVRLLLAAAAWLALVALVSAVAGSQIAMCLGGPLNPEGIRECAEAPGRLAAAIGSPVVVLAGWLAIALGDWADHHLL